jgi:hypothetical protein
MPNDTIPTTEAGEAWLNCIEYTGPGATDPTGGKLPQGWDVIDIIKTVKVMRKHKIIEVPTDDVKKDDKIIKVVMDEDLIKELYDEDPKAILLSSATEALAYTRLKWYKKYGRDGLRVWATSRLNMKIRGR